VDFKIVWPVDRDHKTSLSLVRRTIILVRQVFLDELEFLPHYFDFARSSFTCL
jgi:hypothetical protein